MEIDAVIVQRNNLSSLLLALLADGGPDALGGRAPD